MDQPCHLGPGLRAHQTLTSQRKKVAPTLEHVLNAGLARRFLGLSGFRTKLQTFVLIAGELDARITEENQLLQILPLPYFLASKFTAYNGRGKNEPRTSHDFEDIVYILDNRTDIVTQLINAATDVKPFLTNELAAILNDSVKQEAIAGNLFYESRNIRFKKIMENIKAIVIAN